MFIYVIIKVFKSEQKNKPLPLLQIDNGLYRTDKKNLSKSIIQWKRVSCQVHFERKITFMKIWRGLYDAYCEKWFSVEPPTKNLYDDKELEELEKVAGITDENREKFQSLFFNFCILYEMSGFHAGFKIALEMMYE